MMFNYCTSASNFHVTIGAGATVTLIGAGGSGNLSMDGLTGTDTGALGVFLRNPYDWAAAIERQHQQVVGIG